MEYNQVKKEERLAAGDVLPKSKQMTQLHTAAIWWDEQTVDGNYWRGYVVEKHDFKQLDPRHQIPGRKYEV